MISLSDPQMTFLLAITAPLAPAVRSRFLQALAARLGGVSEVGDGQLNRVSREILQAARFKPPETHKGQSHLDRKLRA